MFLNKNFLQLFLCTLNYATDVSMWVCIVLAFFQSCMQSQMSWIRMIKNFYLLKYRWLLFATLARELTFQDKAQRFPYIDMHVCSTWRCHNQLRRHPWLSYSQFLMSSIAISYNSSSRISSRVAHVLLF